MKRIFTLFVTSVFACIGIANAQATVESATPQEKVTFNNEVKTDKDAPAFQSEAQIKAENAKRTALNKKSEALSKRIQEVRASWGRK